MQCTVCGLQPARALPIRRHVGLLIVMSWQKINRPLCRDHGRSLTKSFLLRSLWQGWWGPFSMFINFFVVLNDAFVLVLYGRLHPPQPIAVSAPSLGAMNTLPLPPPAGTWQSDPFMRNQQRWHNGVEWTDQVSNDGVTSTDRVGW